MIFDNMNDRYLHIANQLKIRLTEVVQNTWAQRYSDAQAYREAQRTNAKKYILTETFALNFSCIQRTADHGSIVLPPLHLCKKDKVRKKCTTITLSTFTGSFLLEYKHNNPLGSFFNICFISEIHGNDTAR